MTLLRRVVFYILLVTYLITCPLVILYALGYGYNPGHAPHITKMGVISLSTVPSGASVYLGRSRFTEKTPTVIMDLFPGDYLLKAFLKDHRPWARTVTVEPGKATVFEDVLLVPKNLRQDTIAPDSFDDILVLERASFCLLAKGTKLKDMLVFYWRKEKTRPLLAAGSPHEEDRLIEIFHAPRSPMLVLRVKSGSGEKILKLSLHGSRTTVKEFSDLMAGAPAAIFWARGAENDLFALDDGRLFRVDVSSKKTYMLFGEQVQGAGIFDDRLYVIKSNRVLRTDQDGENIELLLDDLELGEKLFDGSRDFQIEKLEDSTLLFWEKDGRLIANRFPFQLAGDGVRGVTALEDKPAMLFWRKESIGVVDFSREKIESDDAFEKTAKPRWIYTRGSDIQQVFRLLGGTHVLFRDGNGVYLLEAFSGPESGARFIVEAKEKSDVLFEEASGKLFYLAPGSGKLSSVELLQKDLFASVKRTFESEKTAVRNELDELSIFKSRLK
ncbi:MAG: PEGA domain-containing protein [Candidatus Omnitrophica bacterium]|nr:PEGA domain-containing protein [Candidatus Omnitrophota bacterium]